MIELSVIIPTYNSARSISECLESIKTQSRPPLETVIVDRYSRDNTPIIGREKGAIVVQTEARRSKARNIGFNHSSGEAVLFIDSDMILTPTVLESCAKGLEANDALMIPEFSVGKGFWVSCLNIEKKINEGQDLLEAPRCFRRNAFSSLGGYDASLEAGEDWDLQERAQRRGLSIGRVQPRILHNEGDAAFVSILHKKYRYGRTMRRYFRSHTRRSMGQLNPIRRILIPSARVTSYDPVLGFGFVLLKTAEFAAAALGGLGALREKENFHQEFHS